MMGELERHESGRDASGPKKQSVIYPPENLQQEGQRGQLCIATEAEWKGGFKRDQVDSGRPCFSCIHIYGLQLNTFQLDWGHGWFPGQHLGKRAECTAKENEDIYGWLDNVHLSVSMFTHTDPLKFIVLASHCLLNFGHVTSFDTTLMYTHTKKGILVKRNSRPSPCWHNTTQHTLSWRYLIKGCKIVIFLIL